MGAPPSSEIVRKSKIDAGRERDAGASLEATRARERDAMEEVLTLQRSLTSSSSVAE